MERQFNEQLKELLELGVEVYLHPLIHAKSLLIDNKKGFVFTANLIGNGLDNGFEVGVTLSEQQTADLSTIHQSWKINFPFRAIKEAKVKDLKEYEFFKDQKLTKKILLDDKKQEKRKVVKVADLLSFFNQKFDIKDHSTKSLALKLTAEIEELPTKYKANGSDKFEVIEVDEGKGGKFTLVAIKKSFSSEDITQITELKECRIYAV